MSTIIGDPLGGETGRIGHTTRPRRPRNTERRRMRTILLVLTGMSALAASGPAAADVAEFYRGKTITVVNGGGSGGGSTVYTQVIAPLLQKHMPGNPGFVIQYMPGAGGARAANYLYSAAAKDGTVLGRPLQEIAFFALLGAPGLQYDAAHFQYIGGAYTSRSTISVMKQHTPVRTIEDARRTEVIVAAGGKASQPYMYPTLANALVGTKFKLVMGYPGTGAMNLAMERGEVHGRAGSWNSFRGAKPHWVEQDMLANLAVIGLDREPDLPDVPLLTDFIAEPADRVLMEVVASTALFAHAWLAPPGVPADRVAALREAFARTLNDPELIAQMKKRQAELDFISWRQLHDAVEKQRKIDRRSIDRLRAILDL
jgi:tripartite-type tricarboxylate transporter receptor subunit TctC